MTYINYPQETEAINAKGESLQFTNLTTELHTIRANNLHYSILLRDLEKHIRFIRDTSNPMMDDMKPKDRANSRKTMHRECHNLLTEANRLRTELSMQELRLKNALDLVGSISLSIYS